jgi:uncharacterized protein YeeX (DUF496 family)
MERPRFFPGLTGTTDPTLKDVHEHIRLWRVDTLATVEALRADRREVDDNQKHLESPEALYEYVDFFVNEFTRRIDELDQIVAELQSGPRRSHVDALRQIARHAAAEQRRCLQFRDKWVNRPLPHEQVRPLLNRILSNTRDQLVDYYEMTNAARQIAAFTGSEPATGQKGIGRRELFSRLLRRDRDGRS